MSDLIIFLGFYILIVFSVVGYGNFFVHFLKDSNIINCFGIQGLIGVSFLTILSYSSSEPSQLVSFLAYSSYSS